MSQLCVLPFPSVTFLENAKVFGFFFNIFFSNLLLTLTWGSLHLLSGLFCFALWFYSQLHIKLYIILK